jgi:regulator of protease activity HflC (stomatin/prohibitin superfamily)
MDMALTRFLGENRSSAGDIISRDNVSVKVNAVLYFR